MSNNHSIKISQSFLVKIFMALILTAIVVGNIRVIIDNIVSAKGIDEKLVSEANPRLNKKLTQQAIEILESFSSQELTSISPTATVEQESENSKLENPSSISVEIRNASGINGAASQFAEKLSLIGYQISAISTAPSLEGQSKVFFKPGKAEEAQNVKKILQEEKWPARDNEQTTAEQQYDLLIILGK